MIRLLRLSIVVAGALVAYVVFTFAQVWLAARRDEARTVQAIVVLGAAQYNGIPSEILEARLDHAYDLYRREVAPVVVVTGGNQPGDQYTEATAAADYLLKRGVPDEDILREVSGRSSWESLAATAAFLKAREIRQVLLVSDPFHSFRVAAIAEELGLEAYTSPTRSSPISGTSEVRHLLRETAAVALGRVIGYRREAGIHETVGSELRSAGSGEYRSGLDLVG